ncbi:MULTISPECIES: AMP-binding protein [unclassified Bradyrhizobium]|uniref:AMP-binding protein n=1 Tax=unclassified Bradyrhizobium TaxID=2631580 RepID=UPI0028EE21AF|nr:MULTISPECIES: AMP-binding protein [unclassified Bradyrhizobium]
MTTNVAARATSDVNFAPREVSIEAHPDGSLILRSPINFVEPSWSVTDFLPVWAMQEPDRVFLAQREAAGWQKISYRQMWLRTQSVGQGLIDRGAQPGDRIAILSGNSIEHAIVMFAAMSIGMAVAPISPNYTLMPGGLSRLTDIARLLKPSFVFVQDGSAFAAARSVSGLEEATWIACGGSDGLLPLEALYEGRPTSEFQRRFGNLDRDAIAKILFTSGSTGLPKGVINTHRMMACALEMGSLLAPANQAPVQVEWLPWHHTMGGNVILQGTLKNGGTLYIDDGRPVPQLFHKTVANLREIFPTAMFNVPGGYTLLCDVLEADEHFRNTFFNRMERMTYAGAAIPQSTLDKLYDLSLRATGRRIPVMSGYGTTETAPTISTTHWATEEPGEVGLPGPGLRLKLLPAGDSYEVRVKGPNVTPGYFGRSDLTESAFDEEGYYRVGDTVAFLDPKQPHLGLRFTGRLSENFKLTNGTWVVVGNLRATILGATRGVLQDVVIAGENRDQCAVLAWLNPSQAKQHASAPVGDLERDPGVLAFLRECFRAHNETVGSSERIRSFKLLKELPSLAAGEITDKAYVNQRAVLGHRAHSVEELYAGSPAEDVTFI